MERVREGPRYKFWKKYIHLLLYFQSCASSRGRLLQCRAEDSSSYASVTWQNRFWVFTGFGSCQGFWKPGKEKSKGLTSQGLVNVYILCYLGSRFPTKDT